MRARLLLLALILPASVSAQQPQRDAEQASRFWRAALARKADLDLDGALELLRAARQSDPSFLPAHFSYIDLMRVTRAADRLRQEYAGERLRSAPSGACLSVMAAAPIDYDAGGVETLLALERARGPDRCSTFSIARSASSLLPASAFRALQRKYQQAAAAQFPEIGATWAAYASTLEGEGAREEAHDALTRGIGRAADIQEVIELHMQRYGLYLLRGDTARAAAVLQALAVAVRRDGRAGPLWWYLRNLAAVRVSDATFAFDSASVQLIAIARSAGAAVLEWHANMTHARSTIDKRGDPAGALRSLDRAVALADSLQNPRMQQEAYLLRGRARSKAGLLAAAESDLLHSIAVPGAAVEVVWLAEAYHNLAHTYEGMGRFAQASRVADRFIALTQPLRHAPIRMMSLRDAGLIRWKAGWHAAADAAFREMVRVVRENEREHYWAGEYFERTGDLERALHYYRRGLSRKADELALNLAGIARVHEALGMLDSAETAARAHDRLIMGLLDMPIVPGVLARHGRLAEAAAIWREWAEKRTAEGNLQQAAQARLQLADLLFRGGSFVQAEQEAARAENLAAGLNLTDELIWSWRVRGRTRIRSGDERTGLALLRRAAAHADVHPTSDGILATNLALAEALAEARRPAEALAAYDRAAQAVERVTGQWSQDLDRARYREHQLAPFDGALRLLLRDAAAADGRLDQLVAWSARRKAAALALSAAIPTTAREVPGSSLAAVQAALGDEDALLDYIAADSDVAVLVLTRHTANLVRLPASVQRIRRWADELRRPLIAIYAGRVDLARATFDLQRATALYRAVLAPLQPLLAGSRRLLVVPDGPLHHVPFDALPAELPDDVERGDGDAGERYRRAVYVIDRFEITYLPSTQFVAPRRPRLHDARVLAVTRAAPGGAQELAAVSEIWPADRITLLADHAATETATRRAAAGADVVHLAVHARASDDDPQTSYLALGRDDRNDGYYHLGEIAGERSRAELVVLSACETHGGRLFNGEGFMGLARAFLASGAGAVVASQWSVGPSAAELMSVFYRRLSAGDDAAAALHAAKLALRHDPDRAHPFHWAGFLLTAGRAAIPEPLADSRRR